MCSQWKLFGTISTNWLFEFCTNMAANLADRVGGVHPRVEFTPLNQLQLQPVYSKYVQNWL